MRRAARVAAAVVVGSALTVPPAGATEDAVQIPVEDAVEPVTLPAARVGDRWRVGVLGDTYEMTIEERTSAGDRFGRELEAFAVAVDGFHPVAFESKQLTRHVMYLDAASGTQIADVAEYVFGGGDGMSSEPAAYSAYEPNDPDGWPGWVQTGGLLAGRTVTPGGEVELPFVMTNTSGADRISLLIEEAPAGEEGERCVRATGETTFPSYTYWSTDGYRRGELTVGLDLVHCDDAPYARRTIVTYAGVFDHAVEFTLEAHEPGAGEPVGAGAYREPDHHVASPAVPFDGALRDGGPVQVPSLEAAQDAAALAPGLAAWRLVHPDGYLVEAELLLSELQSLPPEADRWRLVYAAPGGAAHEVHVTMRTPAPVAVDVPRADAYPAAVPPLSSWPPEVASLFGIVTAWRALAGDDARLSGLHWQPLLDDHWWVIGVVDITCDGEPCGDLFVQIPFDHRTGAAGTGEHPLP